MNRLDDFKMIDAIVQLLRNFMCCIKDLNIFADSFIHIPIPTVLSTWFNYDIDIPHPLNLTTPLEFLIGLSQFFAHYSATKSGYNMTQKGYAKLQYINYLINVREKQTKSDASSTASEKKAEQIMDERLAAEKYNARKSVIVGICVFCIGIVFFWLFANSFHVTSTDWIGGLAGLMISLAVNEIVLIPLIYYMLVDGNEKMSNSTKLSALSNKETLMSLEARDLDTKTFDLISNHVPFWSKEEKQWNVKTDAKFAQQEFMKEIKSIQSSLNFILSKDSKDKFDTMSEQLKLDSAQARMEGWREYIYFILNLLAFYGYLLGVLVYIWNDEANEPSYMTQVKFGMTHADADWRGNFLGDVMWTVEPMVILSSPYIFSMLTPPKKVKSE